ncbi:uncharacterized protein J4E79_009303 [Alternaria viburni]|uniref:uncharacterized protein n=1 Tax=Alternaria viburni TaxID=566460 RepID=UPI0020C2F451|nr:uncharacterized protein J4E79_009303 [Alternaria viburni]KAI4651106.1 hypothetical protein J4E79_009303 [Alternaria viburni]
MEDSPLSVIANIAGILTFAVAILASIYVRFVSLRNGRIEMQSIQDSVVDVLNDLEKMNSSASAVLQGNTHLIVNQDDEDDVIWLKRLGSSLLATEILILAYCLRAMNAETSMVEAALSSARSLQDIGITPTTFTDFVLKSREATQKATQKAAQNSSDHLKQFMYLLPEPLTDQLPMSWVLYVLTVGSTPTLMRWYRVREKVLEKVREREILRSRILSHQVSMANS